MSPDKFVSKPSDIPTVEHYAIFEASSYRIDGYDRYDPGTTDYFVKYEAYLTKEKLLKAIEEYESSAFSKRDYRACLITPMVIEKTIKVSVK